MLLWFHDWASGKLVDGSRVTSAVFFVCLSAWVLVVCVCVCSCLVHSGVYAIDSSLPMSNLVFVVVVCLCMFRLWVISCQCWQTTKRSLSSPICRYPHSCPKTGFQFSAVSAEIAPPYFWAFGLQNVFCPQTTRKIVISAIFSLATFKNGPAMLYNIEGPFVYISMHIYICVYIYISVCMYICMHNTVPCNLGGRFWPVYAVFIVQSAKNGFSKMFLAISPNLTGVFGLPLNRCFMWVLIFTSKNRRCSQFCLGKSTL